MEKKRERNMTGDMFMSPVMCRASIREKEREKEGNRGVLGPPRASKGWPLEGGEFVNGLLKY